MRYLGYLIVAGAALAVGAVGACVKVLGPDGRDAAQIKPHRGTVGTGATAYRCFTGEVLTADDSTVVNGGAKVTSIRTSAVTIVRFPDISSNPRPLNTK